MTHPMEERRERYADMLDKAHREWLRPGSEAGRFTLADYFATAALALADEEIAQYQAAYREVNHKLHGHLVEAERENEILRAQLDEANERVARGRRTYRPSIEEGSDWAGEDPPHDWR